MKKYINSLLPYRWIIVLSFILCLALVIEPLFQYKLIPHLVNIIFWFIIDYVFGLGHRGIINKWL